MRKGCRTKYIRHLSGMWAEAYGYKDGGRKYFASNGMPKMPELYQNKNNDRITSYNIQA